MKFLFLGTGASYPTVNRGVSSVALQFESGSVWLFDCGEGTQIQLQKIPIHRRKINKLFITHLHGDHVFGLPGLLCTISSQLSLPDSDKASVLDIYGPLGLKKFIYTALTLSRSPLLMKYKVHELEPVIGQYPDDSTDWPLDHHPPASLHPSEIPGRIIKAAEDGEGNQTWKIIDDDAYSVTAGAITHRIPSFGFVIREKDRVGTLLAEKLLSLGVKPGPLYGKLKLGIPVTLENGTEIHPKEVTGPNLKGRTVVICGDTCDASGLRHLVSECDVLIHEATHDDELVSKALEFGHSTPSMAAKFCEEIRAKILLLNHFSQRYSDNKTTTNDSDESTDLLLKQAKSHLAGRDVEVHCAYDTFVFELRRPKREGNLDQ